MRLYGQSAAPADKVPKHLKEKYENEAGRYWDLFYKRNADKFFKDRHYFDKEFPELTQGQLTVLEVGCGVGNTVFPLLDINPQLQVYACDFSPTAVELVQAHPSYSCGRVKAFVADITRSDWSGQLPGPCVDYCSMVFVLSAVAPEKMPQAIRNVASVLKPGSGRVLFRDYAEGDLAQTRLEGSSGVKFITENFYVRGDGTCCYYYNEEGLTSLFSCEGFVCESMLVHARLIENRKSGVKMLRRWIQAVFRYAPDEAVQQQQQQHLGGVEQQQQQQQPQNHVVVSSGSSGSSSSSSSTSVMCAGRSWQVPCTASSSSNGTCKLQQFARALDGLLQQQQQHVLLLGKCLLLAPPWLQLNCVAAEHDARQQQQQDGDCQLLLLHPAAPPAASVYNNNSSSSSCENDDIHFAQGAAAALLALIAVWHGARRVYACMPGASLNPGAYELGFNRVLQLNECSIVCERVRQRRWDVAERRHMQLLCRELAAPGEVRSEQPDRRAACTDLVVAQRAAAAAAAPTATEGYGAISGSGFEGCAGSAGCGAQESQEVQGLVDQIFGDSKHVQLLCWSTQISC